MTQLVRLSTGEELLCKIKDNNETHLTVSNPVQLIPTQDGQITFIPYISYCEFETLPIKVEHVMFILNPSEGLAEKYESMISGKPTIQQPPTKIIT